MKIVICDDEAEYVNDVKRHINQYFSEHGLSADIYCYYRSEDILKSSAIFDIAFLDIEMDKENGIKIAKELQHRNPEIVLIFITAYEHYLDEALDLGTTRFFDKPIDSQRFYKGLDKAISKVDKSEITIFVNDGREGKVKIRINEIIFLEILGRKTKVVTVNGEYYSTENLKFWKNKLNKSYFASPHNSFIVNTNYITYFQSTGLRMYNKYYVPIAHSRRSEFKRKFMMLIGD